MRKYGKYLFGFLAITTVALSSYIVVNHYEKPTINTVDEVKNVNLDSYYKSATGTGNELRMNLRSIISKKIDKGYNELANTYKSSDMKPDGYLNDIYSNITKYKISDAGSSAKNENEGWNKEHTIPQSWFNKNSSPRQDPFIVYPTDIHINSLRSSYSFGEVSSIEKASANNYSKLGPSKYKIEGEQTVFEPNDEWKGDMARVYFYATTCYNTDTWTGNKSAQCFSKNGTNGLTDYALNLFLKWHKQDPVSDWEIHRNNAIYSIYNNRNPFIDHPEWVNSIWGESEEIVPPGPVDPDTPTDKPTESPTEKPTTPDAPSIEGETASLNFEKYGEDSGTALDSSAVKNLISDEKNLISNIEVTGNIYKGKEGLKFGSSNKNGSITINFVSPLKLSKINLKVSQYGSDSSNLIVNDNDLGIISGTDTVMPLELSNEGQNISSLTITNSGKRFYLGGIELVSPKEETNVPVPVQSINLLSDKKVTLEVGKEYQIKYEVLPENATDKSVTYSTTDDESISISETGLLKAVKETQAEVFITTNDGNKQVSFEVDVVYDPITPQPPVNPDVPNMTGVIIGSVLGSIAGIAVIVTVSIYFVRKSKKKEDK